MARWFTGNPDEIISTINGVSGLDVTVKSWCGAVYVSTEPSNAQVLFMSCTDDSAASSKRQAMAINVPNSAGFRFHWTQDFATTDLESYSDNDFALDTWHYWAVTYDRSSGTNVPTLYVNGSAEGMTNSPDGSGTVATGDDTMKLGHNPDGGTLWLTDGAIAEITGWDVALSTGQLASLDGSINPTTVQTGDLIWYSPLYGDAASEPEEIQSLTLTVTGATYYQHPPVPWYRPRILMKSDEGGINHYTGVRVING